MLLGRAMISLLLRHRVRRCKCAMIRCCHHAEIEKLAGPQAFWRQEFKQLVCAWRRE
jgi:hypothetical protein